MHVNIKRGGRSAPELTEQKSKTFLSDYKLPLAPKRGVFGYADVKTFAYFFE